MLEAGWVEFQAELETSKDLDGVIAAHDRYLDSVLQKVLLGEKSQLLLRQLATIFDVVLRFRAVCDRIYEQASGFRISLDLPNSCAFSALLRRCAVPW